MDRSSLQMLVLIIAIPFFVLMGFLTHTFGINDRAALPAFSLGQVCLMAALTARDFLGWSQRQAWLWFGGPVALLSLILALVRISQGTLTLSVIGGWIFGLIIGAGTMYAGFRLYHGAKRPNP
jgi:hypothetical protein